jgi:acyl carrier protein phosphodiesterase
LNHLAHFHLAGSCEGHIVGALLGDYIKGPLRGEWPAPLESGIRLHRRIDAYTDAHPELLPLRAPFPAGQRRLAGVVTDMIFDHLLVRHWSHFHDAGLPQFARDVHAILLRHRALLPAAALAHARRMDEYDLLARYGEAEVVEGALRHIGQRLGCVQAMDAAITLAWRHMDGFEQAFLSFYPQLVDMAAGQRLSAA